MEENSIEVLGKIIENANSAKKMLAVLIDPDKSTDNQIDALCKSPFFGGVDFVFVGGSLVPDGSTKKCIYRLKQNTSKPVVIFPGSPNQIDNQADSILLLSLISGRNPDLLIGRHVEAAYKLKESGLEIIPTGYMLIDGGKMTTVAYVSGTVPIPREKSDIAAATALAGKQLGLKLLYLDCGSGAKNYAPHKIISVVKSESALPVIVGGGIRNKQDALSVYASGADVVVVGNKLEEDPTVLEDLVYAKEEINKTLTQTP